MLHTVNLPGCISQLERIVEFQREVLQYACERSYHLPLQENNLKALFDDDKGEWLWGKLWKQNGQKSKFHKHLEDLAEYYQRNPQQGSDTLDAFDNDIEFADKLDDANFRFQYPNLEEATRDLIKPLMVAFYEDLLASGFLEVIHGVPDRLNRDDFIESFWNENVHLNVCPACDRERSEKVDQKVYDDADHFLPKSKYPFLSLHPFNLFPLCIYCNRSFKGNRDMVDNHANAPLVNIFHPYKRTAIKKLNLQVYRDDKGVTRLREFVDVDGMPSRRMNSLNRVFRLNERWIDRLRIQKESIVDKVNEEGNRLRRRNQLNLLTEEELRTVLQEEKEATISKYGKRAGFIIQNSYIDCALSDNEEFEELLNYFTS